MKCSIPILIREKRYKTTNTTANPSPRFILYKPANMMKAINNKLPKPVSNKLTNNPGTANIMTHNTISKVIKPTTKFIFFFENTPPSENPIYNIILKKLNANYLKRTQQINIMDTSVLRLNIISLINASWYKQLLTFLKAHPSYNMLLPIVALDEYPPGFNKNPQESDPNAPHNIFETILHGLAYAGVDIDYGKIQYLLITNYFRQFNELNENMVLPNNIQPEKVPIYKALIKKMVDEDIAMDELLYNEQDMRIIESVEGMTESTITLLHLLYGPVESDRCLPFNDKQFKRGMCMFYDLTNPTKEELKKYTDKWVNKKVGLMFVVQLAHYPEYVNLKPSKDN